MLETHRTLEVHSFTKYLKAQVLSGELFLHQDTVGRPSGVADSYTDAGEIVGGCECGGAPHREGFLRERCVNKALHLSRWRKPSV